MYKIKILAEIVNKISVINEILLEYFSALSNEANLHERACAWLLFGIDDKTHAVLGTCYKPTYASLQALKREVAEGTNGGMTFTEIHSLQYEGKRVLLFEIPAAPRGIPTAYKGHFFGRDGESLVALSIDKLERIRRMLSMFPLLHWLVCW